MAIKTSEHCELEAGAFARVDKDSRKRHLLVRV